MPFNQQGKPPFGLNVTAQKRRRLNPSPRLSSPLGHRRHLDAVCAHRRVQDYTIPMLEQVFGTSGRLAEMQVSGMTDLQLVTEALRDEGFTHEDVRERIDHLRERYMEEMKRATGNGDEFFELLPGVRETLQAISAQPRYRSALLTGNIEPAAYLKVELMGLAEFFDLPGAFGDESHDRSDLPELAAERIRQHLGVKFEPQQFIVIGDTPNAYRLRQTLRRPLTRGRYGPLYRTKDLLECDPDAFIPNLADPGLVLSVLNQL